MHSLLFLANTFIVLLHLNGAVEAETINYADYVTFKFFKNNSLAFESRSAADDMRGVCSPAEPWLMIVPGWTDNCGPETPWLPPLIQKFTQYRGGCICCMDYWPLSKDPSIRGYIRLFTHFDGLAAVLAQRLRLFERQGFHPQRGYMFGMSFGSRLAIDGGRRSGGRLAGLDACDPAGPLFYPNAEMQARGSVRLAARNVQVIHTSADEGTIERDGHQDWCMGNCGLSQAAAGLQDGEFAVFGKAAQFADRLTGFYVPFSRKNHNMCPKFYLTAFEQRFEAVANPCCPRSERDAVPPPVGYRMGYMQPDKGRVQNKTLFALSYAKAPYCHP